MKLTLAIDPGSTDDIRNAIQALERLLPPGNVPPNLAHIIGAVANKDKYGNGRLGYLAAVAKAGDSGVPISTLMNDHFGGNFQSFGGTHASIEKTWRALGGTAWAEKLIDDTPDKRQVMLPAARELILMCVGLLNVAEELAAGD